MDAQERIAAQKALIKQRKQEMLTAGGIHRKDLERNVRRLEKELRTYIRYQREASIAS